MTKYTFSKEKISESIDKGSFIKISKPKNFDIEKCPKCNRAINKDKTPIRVAINEEGQVKPAVIIDNDCYVWGGIEGEKYQFGSMGDNCWEWAYGSYITEIANFLVYKGCKKIETEKGYYYDLDKKTEHTRRVNFIRKFYFNNVKLMNKWGYTMKHFDKMGNVKKDILTRYDESN